MKNLLTIVSLLSTVSAAAGSYTRAELLDIDSSYQYRVLGQTSIEGRNVSILNACITNSSVKTIDPVTVCTEYDYILSDENGSRADRLEKVCVSYENVDLEAPLSATVKYCKSFKSAGYDGRADAINNLPESCRTWGTKAVKARTSFYPEIVTQTGNKDTAIKFAGSKKYLLPKCK